MTLSNLSSNIFYEQAIEHISVGIHAIDLEGKTIIYNKKMQDMEGTQHPTMTNQSPLELFQFKLQESTLLHVLQTEKPLLNHKQTYWNKEGHEITSLNDTFPLYDDGKLIGAIEFARDITSLEKLVYQPLRRYGEPLTFDIITAVSGEMKQVIEIAKKAAYTETPVLLIGESGTGKDMIAEGIHHYLSPQKEHFMTFFSRREDEQLITKVQEALESEDPITFFFERIEFLEVSVQQNLLSLLLAIPTKRHMIIGSTGSDPIKLIANGTLLKELYYFFAAFSITIPPLRQRKVDIKPFIDDYFARHRKRFQSQICQLDDEVLTLFLAYDWPGNLKELELLLDEMAATLTNETTITQEMLPLHFLFKAQHASTDKVEFFIPRTQNDLLPFDEYMRNAEMFYLQNVMKIYNGNITKAAAALQMSRQNLQYRLRKMKK